MQPGAPANLSLGKSVLSDQIEPVRIRPEVLRLNPDITASYVDYRIGHKRLLCQRTLLKQRKQFRGKETNEETLSSYRYSNSFYDHDLVFRMGAGARGIHQRIHHQQERIQRGVATGTLTRHEAAILQDNLKPYSRNVRQICCGWSPFSAGRAQAR